jgi:hypothetical protein
MSKEVIRNSRFFARPVEDYPAGAMTSVHSLITLDREANELRGRIYLRDCDSEISFEFWAGNGARPGGRERAREMIAKLQTELTEFAADFDRSAMELGIIPPQEEEVI